MTDDMEWECIGKMTTKYLTILLVDFIAYLLFKCTNVYSLLVLIIVFRNKLACPVGMFCQYKKNVCLLKYNTGSENWKCNFNLETAGGFFYSLRVLNNIY
jgi:hypothetical protein